MDINAASIANTIIGTVPLAIVIVAWIIRIEQRITRIETILEIKQKDKCQAGGNDRYRSTV